MSVIQRTVIGGRAVMTLLQHPSQSQLQQHVLSESFIKTVFPRYIWTGPKCYCTSSKSQYFMRRKKLYVNKLAALSQYRRECSTSTNDITESMGKVI